MNINDLKFDSGIDAPIVLIDSGVGGLRILSKLAEEFPVENFVYFCDNEIMPLGNKNEAVINRRVSKICKMIKKINPKAVVIACNTIDSISYNAICAFFPNINVYSVIIPTINKALEISKTKNIAVMATKNTIENQSYIKYALKRSNLNIYGVECINLAKAIETNEDIKSTLREETGVLQNIDYDTLVLGCTHYSSIKKLIANNFADKNIIDCSEELISSFKAGFPDNIKNRANKQKIYIVLTNDSDLIKINIQKIIKQSVSLIYIKI